MQGRAAAAAGNVRIAHIGAPKLKTAAAATTRKTNNSESRPRLGRPRAEGKIFALLYILVAFVLYVSSVFFFESNQASYTAFLARSQLMPKPTFFYARAILF